MNYMRDYEDRSLWKGVLAGIAGGFAASWAMNQFQASLAKASQPAEGQQNRTEQSDSGGDATMKAAEAISETIGGRPLSKHEKQTAGPIIHYTFGSSMGAAYGAFAELAPRAATGWGLPFGAALWLVADEIAVPALGLSKSPSEYPATTHASALAAHLVYGLTTDLVRRGIRAAW